MVVVSTAPHGLKDGFTSVIAPRPSSGKVRRGSEHRLPAKLRPDHVSLTEMIARDPGFCPLLRCEVSGLRGDKGFTSSGAASRTGLVVSNAHAQEPLRCGVNTVRSSGAVLILHRDVTTLAFT